MKDTTGWGRNPAAMCNYNFSDSYYGEQIDLRYNERAPISLGSDCLSAPKT